ncbi:hypothetical protein TWF696_009076 [Orbilia brochopaga]|uniref:Zn(2)-C6 fungal-type domain-containing protein n=1 Tax=Orbilia brochopaga TaxID=3140254 RepID=A0AAV9UGF2_9PEZI
MSEPVALDSQLPPDLPEKSGGGGSDPSKPARVSKKRTKTGCLTCRKRRIKCGEERPTCNNCVKSKRVCEGYSQRVVFKLGGLGPEEAQLDPMGFYGYPDQQMPYNMSASDPALPYALHQPPSRNPSLQRIAPAPAYSRRIGDEGLPENQLHSMPPPHLQPYLGSHPQHHSQESLSALSDREGYGEIPPGYAHDPNFDAFHRHRSSMSPVGHIETGLSGRRRASMISPIHPPPLSATESHWPASATSATHPSLDAGYSSRHHYAHETTPPSAMSSGSYSLPSPTAHRHPMAGPSRPSNALPASPHHPHHHSTYGYNPYDPGVEEHHEGYPHHGQYPSPQYPREPEYDHRRFQGFTTAGQEQQQQEQQQRQQQGQEQEQVIAAAANQEKQEVDVLQGLATEVPGGNIGFEGYEIEGEEVEIPDYDDSDDEDGYDDDEGDDEAHETVPMDLDVVQRNKIATALTPYTQNNESTRLTFRSFLPEAGTLIRYSPNGGSSPLSDPTTARVFCHWIYVVAPSLSIFERHPANPHQAFRPGTKLNGPQNVWCYTIPTMSLSSPLLLHAVLAVASLHIARLSDEPITASYVHYHFSLRRLRKAISDDKERASVTTLAGTLLLAYYETMAADVRKWSSHLQGAKNLLKEIDFDNLNRRMEILEDEELTQQQQQSVNSPFDGIPSARNLRMHHKAKAGLGPERPPPRDPIRRYIFGSRQRRKASQLDRARAGDNHASNARDQEIAILQSDMFWFFAKQDAYQALLSGDGLVLDYAHWSKCPPRSRIGTLGTLYGSTDYLFLLYGRLADFQARDAKRKAEVEKYGPAPAILELMKSGGGGPRPPGQGGGGPPGPPPGSSGPSMAGPSGGPQTGGPPGGPPPGWQGGPPPGWQGGPPPGWQGGPPPGWQGGPPPGWQGGPPPGWQGGPPPGWQGGPPPGMTGPSPSAAGIPPGNMPPPGPPYTAPGATSGGMPPPPAPPAGGPRMPPPTSKYTKAELESMTAEAELEWIEIKKALLLFQESLGDEFQPLKDDLMPVQDSPFGTAIFYRTYSVSCLQTLYKTAHLILERCHPSMPSNGWIAASVAARKTAAIAHEMGRIAAGLFPPLHATEISPPLGGALIELSFCMLFAGVQFQDPSQREWLADHLYNVGKLTGWGTADRCALGCEHAWEKASAMGKGPPYTRRRGSEPREAPVGGAPEGPNYVFLGSANKAHWATGLLGPLEHKMEDMAL